MLGANLLQISIQVSMALTSSHVFLYQTYDANSVESAPDTTLRTNRLAMASADSGAF